jgi:hypothetical protein
MGDDFRWVTVYHPDHRELEITLMKPGPPLDPDAADFVRASSARARWAALGLSVDDCRKTYDELSALGGGVRAGARRPALRRGGRDARRLGQLAGARRAARVHPDQP